MAATPEMTIEDISGKWTISEKLSDPLDGVLALQGVPALSRVAARYIHVSKEILMKPDSEEVDAPIRFSMSSRVEAVGWVGLGWLGGLGGGVETHLLDNKPFIEKDPIVGEIKGKMWFVYIRNLEDQDYPDVFLHEDRAFLENGRGTGNEVRDRVIRVSLRSLQLDGGSAWWSEHVWGFEVIEGVRWNTRRIVTRKGKGKVERARLVYEFWGSVDGEGGESGRSGDE